MFTFAHNGVDHGNTAETISHALPAILGITVFTLLALVLIARLLVRQQKKEKNEE